MSLPRACAFLPSCACALLALFSAAPRASAQTLVGPYIGTVVSGELYVVYSEIANVSTGQVTNTSDLYVLRGELLGDGTRRVWIFGSGYGDPNGDVLAYRVQFDAAQNALFDAGNVDTVIAAGFGLSPSEVVLSFLAPHGHLDHVNQEIFTGLESLGYTIDQILIHARDLMLATCNTGTPCCGSPSCTGSNHYFGAPYDPPWDAATLALFQTIGGSDDTCDNVVLSFPTAGLGTARVRADPGHTPGTIDLTLPTPHIFLRGATPLGSCRTDSELTALGWDVHHIHGRP